MNKTTMKEKAPYETPQVLDIEPVSTVRGQAVESTLADDPDNQAGTEF